VVQTPHQPARHVVRDRNASIREAVPVVFNPQSRPLRESLIYADMFELEVFAISVHGAHAAAIAVPRAGWQHANFARRAVTSA